MRSISGFIVFLFISVYAYAQTAPSKYWIQFTDKNGTPHSLSTPLSYLSQRAIDRRIKQNIALDSTDLPISPSYITSIAAIDSISVLNRSKWFNAITIKTTDTNALNAVKALPFVKTVQPVGIIKRKDDIENSFININDDNFSTYSKIRPPKAVYNYGASATQISMIGVDCMHNKGYTGENIVISVLDAGFSNANIAKAFDTLFNNNRVLGTWDYVNGESSVYEDHTHGMHVLSTMAANQSGFIIGTAPKAQYWLLRTEEAATEFLIEEDNWVSAAEFSDSVGADIINSSLGYTTFDDPLQSHSYSDMDGNTTRITLGADLAAKKGILVVNSAGNSGSSSWKYIGAPADGDSVLSIGAVDEFRAYASFSSIGPSYDGRIKPNVSAMGQGTIISLASGGIAAGNGTSFSGPLIAGAAACLWQANPTAGNMQIIKAIEQSAHQYNNPDYLMGYGIPNFCVADQLLKGVSPEVLNEEKIMQVYPVPFEDNLYFSFYSTSKQIISIELFDTRGRQIIIQEQNIEPNSYNSFTLNSLTYLSKGVYILSIKSASGKTNIYKVVKK